jgi:MoaA/NifB/PqqE/SkfB family radical SAM enzyme
MSEEDGIGGYLENLGLLMTYKCQVACAHCLVHAGPHRTETLVETDAADWITQVARYRDGVVKAINLTGGEPFFDVDALRRLIAMACERGLFATVVTNAHWAVSPDVAIETLRSLPGLLFLQISADEHHQAEIPFERVTNAIAAAQALGLVYRVVVCTEDETSPAYRELHERLTAQVDPGCINTVLTFPAGRAGQGELFRLRKQTSVVPEGACSGADSPTILLDGRVVACVGPVIEIREAHPLLLGNLRERPLADILDEADTNSLLHFIRVWGPGLLLDLLEDRGLGDRLPTRFVPDSICDVCYRLFSDGFLREAARELAQEEDFIRTVALGRQRHLKEDGMVGLR